MVQKIKYFEFFVGHSKVIFGTIWMQYFVKYLQKKRTRKKSMEISDQFSKGSKTQVQVKFEFQISNIDIFTKITF